MSNSPDAAASAASSARQVDRRRSVQDLLDEADASLRRGVRPKEKIKKDKLKKNKKKRYYTK